MSRIYKFRAWGTRVAGDQKLFDDMQYFSLFSLDTDYIINYGRFIDEKSVIMQFTGVLDSKGKEIYEGDILSWGSCPVEFDLGRYWVDSQNLDEIHMSIEVIGNIYENPELLKENL